MGGARIWVAKRRHAVAHRLPSSMRDALVRAAPRTDRPFSVPLPDGGALRLVSPDAHRDLNRLYWEGPSSYEPTTARTWWCLARRARLVVDAGAYAGYYALLACQASPSATVHAYEPHPDAFRLLRAAAEANPSCVGLRIHAVALGRQAGRAELRSPTDPPNRIPTVSTTSTAAQSERGERTTNSMLVDMVDLDSALAAGGSDLDLLKLDVEGAEHDVLRGAERSIGTARPDIITEVHLTGDTPAGLRWLTDHGYRLFDLTGHGPEELTLAEVGSMRNRRQAGRHAYGEVLASARSDQSIGELRGQVSDLDWPARSRKRSQ